MQIDNKTRAAVLREYADEMKARGGEIMRQMLYARADKLDPPLYPIHPHAGCDGMLVVGDGISKAYVHIDDEHSERWQVPREASKVPAFLCDGTQPEWVKDDDMVLVIDYRRMQRAYAWIWPELKHCFFCVINPIEVQ